METINPSYYPASRAAGVAENYINYKLGSPHRLFQVKQVTEAIKESIPGVGNKYYLSFVVADFLNEQPDIKCTAEVLYYLREQNKAPNVSFTLEREIGNYVQDKDIAFYNKMKNISQPLVAQDIPDKFGNVSPEMEPVLHLALVACGHVKWQHSTEDTYYRMSIIKSVRQLKREDNTLEFHYIMLIHEMVTQEIITWEIHILWDPTQGLKIEKEVILPKSNQ
ncbi:latexin [Pelobates fuscus]|uniref:latexin n=1 Tax=Pelobates fuscus TaxID=191477 RepID=UPI002FE48CEF